MVPAPLKNDLVFHPSAGLHVKNFAKRRDDGSPHIFFLNEHVAFNLQEGWWHTYLSSDLVLKHMEEGYFAVTKCRQICLEDYKPWLDQIFHEYLIGDGWVQISDSDRIQLKLTYDF